MAAFLYTPLEDWQMRVLELHPGTFGQPLTGSLHVVDILDFDGVLIVDQRRRVEYHALSYWWGEPVFDKNITCNGVELSITSDIHAAIQRIRPVDQKLFLWIDSICIDQSNTQERSKQVSMMLKIFSKANSVIIWLGEDDVGEEDDTARYANAVSAPILQQRRLLHALSKRSWFERVWVRQEVWAASRVEIRWHDRSVPWEQSFGRYEETLGIRRASRLERFRATLGDEMRNILADIPLTLDLVSVLNRCAGTKCTDLRDHVYGVLGMSDTKTSTSSSQHSSDIFLTVDYSRPAASVFQDVAEYIIGRDGNLALLYLCPRPGSKVEPLDGAIPSWVPDWRQKHWSLISDRRRASRRVFLLHSTPRIHSPIPGGLRVSAWHLGTIARTRDRTSKVAQLEMLSSDALESLRRCCTRKGHFRISIGPHYLLWYYDTAVKLKTQVLHPINYLLEKADVHLTTAYKSPPTKARTDSLRINFARIDDLAVCWVGIPLDQVAFVRLDHQPTWQQVDTKPDALIQMKQAQTSICVGFAKLQGTPTWAGLKERWHGSAWSPGFVLSHDHFNLPPDLWFPSKWLVPTHAKPGDRIMAVCGGCLPIVVRPQPDRQSVTYVGAADFYVGTELYTVGRSIRETESRHAREVRGSAPGAAYMEADHMSSRNAILHFYYDLLGEMLRASATKCDIFEELDIV